VLDQYGLEPRYLELELTESAMMHDATQAVRIVDRLKSIGVHLSLDDFGTGYSSLAYLSRFAIDQLKIDQSFIRDITANPINASIATATIAMAHKLNKKVIAEGVETEAQMTFLRRHDCDEMQGFFFSRPCPAEEIAAMLRQGRRQRFDEGGNKDGQLTLLLIDDEQNILNSLKRLFRRENFRVLTANSGREALELLAVNEVQVIISDQRMPEMSGVELLSRVKELYPDTVRIVLSGYSELSTVTEAINRGAIWKYLSKPWDDDKLRDEVRRAFREARGAVEGNSD
jgi:CheY-like chemotaxis protein